MMREQDAQKQSTEPLTVEENKEYDYNNENDASYCPNHVPVCIVFFYVHSVSRVIGG